MINRHDRAEAVDDLPDPYRDVYHALAAADEPITRQQLTERVDVGGGLVWQALERLLEDDVVDRRRPAPAAQPHYELFRELDTSHHESESPNGR